MPHKFCDESSDAELAPKHETDASDASKWRQEWWAQELDVFFARPTWTAGTRLAGCGSCESTLLYDTSMYPYTTFKYVTS